MVRIRTASSFFMQILEPRTKSSGNSVFGIKSSYLLQAKEKMEAPAPAEPTMPGRVFTPAVDIFETDKEITLLADMPGVKTADLNIDLRDDILTLTGAVAPFEGPQEEDILVEYDIGTYSRQFPLFFHLTIFARLHLSGCSAHEQIVGKRQKFYLLVC